MPTVWHSSLSNSIFTNYAITSTLICLLNSCENRGSKILSHIPEATNLVEIENSNLRLPNSKFSVIPKYRDKCELEQILPISTHLPVKFSDYDCGVREKFPDKNPEEPGYLITTFLCVISFLLLRVFINVSNVFNSPDSL